jgi:c-di-GMP-binding flagellar brake protein YcgR
MKIGSIMIFEVCDNVDIGDKIRDQKKRIWEVLESVDHINNKYKCKLIKIEGENKNDKK